MGFLKLTVEDFGKIKHVEIELTPLTLFIGDNNSGKSYLMTLLYALTDGSFMYGLMSDMETSVEFDEIVESIKQTRQSNDKYTLTYKNKSIITEHLNRHLNTKLELISNYIFNGSVNIGHVQLEFEWPEVDISDHEKYIAADMHYADDSWGHLTRFARDQNDTCYISTFIIHAACKALDISSLYLPTSRTGFLLTRKQLANESIENRFSLNKKEPSYLTKPCVDFIRLLIGIDVNDHNDYFKDITNFIETNMMRGHIESDALPMPDYFYVSDEKRYPMHLTSGVVTELTPLLLALRYEQNFTGLIIEEPEMCLHPELQWKMARVLIKLSKRLQSVLVSTHSDVIIQHIDSMYMLSKNERKSELMKEYGYDEDDLIGRDDVRVYEFNEKNGVTTVTQAELGEYGFKTPTFNNMLRRFALEARAFEGE